MSNDHNYNPNSIDVQLSKLIQQNEFDAEDRSKFRKEIIEELKEIKTQVTRTNGRVTKLEDTQKIHVEACISCKEKIKPIIEAHQVAKNTWFSFKNVMIGISFLLGLALSIYGFFK